MRTIELTTRFRRDLRLVLKGRHAQRFPTILDVVLEELVCDRPLPPRSRDHALSGRWLNHRDCHLLPDLVLIYRFIGNDGLELVRIGSHSELDP